MEEKLNNMEALEEEEKITPAPKKAIKWHIILPIISIIVIGIIILIIILALKDDDNNKCEICIEDKCKTCDGKKCASCNYRYNLINGNCLADFLFRATYETSTENETLILIYSIYKDNIIEMEIDGEVVSPDTNYTFISPGEHTAYFTLNIENLSSLTLFNYSDCKSVYFSKEFNIENITSFEQFLAIVKN